jgi:hypothetical protein
VSYGSHADTPAPASPTLADARLRRPAARPAPATPVVVPPAVDRLGAATPGNHDNWRAGSLTSSVSADGNWYQSFSMAGAAGWSRRVRSCSRKGNLQALKVAQAPGDTHGHGPFTPARHTRRRPHTPPERRLTGPHLHAHRYAVAAHTAAVRRHTPTFTFTPTDAVVLAPHAAPRLRRRSRRRCR